MFTKPASKLFKNIPEEIWNKYYILLCELRKEHPAYSDSDLLIFMLCERELDD